MRSIIGRAVSRPVPNLRPRRRYRILTKREAPVTPALPTSVHAERYSEIVTVTGGIQVLSSSADPTLYTTIVVTEVESGIGLR